MRKIRLSRRTLLKGAGASLGLPWLEAMAPAAVSAGAAPVRMAVLYMANGVNVDQWAVKGEGRSFELSPTLAPLAEFRDKINVISNLWNAAANTGDGHYVKEASILTCTTISKTLAQDINIHGISMDQLAAQRAGERTPLPSLELGIEPESTGVDTNVGYTRVYGSHIAWSNPTTPVAKEINPQSVYERLFRAANLSGGAGSAAKQDVLLLDRVLGQANKLRTEVGTADRARIDEYLEIVRGLETRMKRANDTSRVAWKPRASFANAMKPTDSPKDHTEHVRLMLDMIALAFQTDTTRIATFMFGNAVSGQNFRFLEGVTNTHHEVSHHSKDPVKLVQYHLINRWHVAQYAYLMQKLRAMKEGESNVLDNSMILFASALSDGNSHNPHKLPLVIGGGAGGRLATGQHLVSSEDAPVANLYVSMLSAFGTPVERFADSTGPLPGLLA